MELNLDYLKLVMKSLTRRKIRSWLTMIGIFIGIAAVVSLIGLGQGLRTAITGQFGFLGTDILSIQAAGIGFAGPPGTAVANPLSDDLRDKIAKVPGVKTALNRYIATATFEFNEIQDIGIIGSVPANDIDIFYRILNLDVEEGRLIKDGDHKKAVLGNNFADPESQYGKAIRAGDRVLLSGIEFDVVGILEKKGSFLFDNVVLASEDDTIEYFLEGDSSEVNVIAVQVQNEDEIDKVEEDIEKLLRKERDVKKGEEDFEVQSPQQALQSLDSTLFAIQIFVSLIAIISLLVGGIGIMNTMYTSVVERTKEIGIMKSIGAKNSTIFTLFFLESGFLGAVGGIVGAIIGASIAYGMAAAGRAALGSELIQANVGLGLFLGAITFAFVIGTIFGVLPAIQASKLQPVESLRTVK